MVVHRWDYSVQWRLQSALVCYSSSYPIAGCGQRVIEAAERSYSIKLSDGNRLLTVALLKAQRALYIFLKQML